MNLPKNINVNAFTLIELLLVVSIITIVTGAMIPSFSSFLSDQTLKNAKEQLKDDLRTIQNKSLIGSLYGEYVYGGNVLSSDPKPIKYWVVKWIGGQTSYRVYATYDFFTYGGYGSYSSFCSALPVNDNTFGTAGPKNKYNLPTGITFSSNGCLFFNMSTGFMAYSDGSSNVTTSSTVTLYKGTTPAYLNWNFAGKIGN